MWSCQLFMAAIVCVLLIDPITTQYTTLYSSDMKTNDNATWYSNNNVNFGVYSTSFCSFDNDTNDHYYCLQLSSPGTSFCYIRRSIIIENYRSIQVAFDITNYDLAGSNLGDQACFAMYSFGADYMPGGAIPTTNNKELMFKAEGMRGEQHGPYNIAFDIPESNSTESYLWIYFEQTSYYGNCYYDSVEVRGIYTGPSTSTTESPTNQPSIHPTSTPTKPPTSAPTEITTHPTSTPTKPPTYAPTKPTNSPSKQPSTSPTSFPTKCSENEDVFTNDGSDERNLTAARLNLTFVNPVTDGGKRTIVDIAAAKHQERIHMSDDTIQELQCTSVVGCYESPQISFTNNTICNLMCSHTLACAASTISMSECDDVNIICNGDNACATSDINIINSNSKPSPPNVVIDCGSKHSCRGVTVNVIGTTTHTQISCYGANSCDDIDITVEHYEDSILVMHSHSNNVNFDNGIGFRDPTNNEYVLCNTANRYIPYESTLNDAQINTLVLSEYENNVFPCDGVVIGCLYDVETVPQEGACEMTYHTKQSISVPWTPSDCYWTPVYHIIDITCPGDCIGSPTEPPTSAPTSSPTRATHTPTSDPTSTPTSDPTIDPTDDPTIDPTNDPTIDPTYDPTYDPSSDPTYDPTYNPTMDPTNDPTADPTNDPSNDPTSDPTKNPTDDPSSAPSISPTISPSAAPSHSPTYNPSVAPTLSPSSAPTLAPSVTPSNAPSNAPTRSPTNRNKWESQVSITYVIKYLTDHNLELLEKDTLSYTPRIAAVIEQKYFREEVAEYNVFEVTIQKINDFSDLSGVYLRNGESVELQSTIFAAKHAVHWLIKTSADPLFESDVSQSLKNELFLDNSDLVFSVRNAGALEAIDTDVSMNDESSSVVVFAIMVLVCGTVLSLLIFWINHRKDSKIDDAKSIAPFLFSLQIWDFVSDIFLCYDIGNNLVNDIAFWCFIGSIAFTVVPFLLNIYYGVAITKQEVIRNNRRANEYFTANVALLIGLIVISGGCYNALLVVSCDMFALNKFSSGLTQHELNNLTKIKIKSTIWCENFPQICIQVMYTWNIIMSQEGGSGTAAVPTPVVFAFIGSILSVILTLASHYAQKNVIKDADVMSYYLRFENKAANFKMSTGALRKIENKKGRTKELRVAMVKTLNISEENIQIGYSWILDKGLEMRISHFLTKAELAKHRRNVHGFISEITPSEYVHKLYADQSVKEGIDQVFRAHFGISDADFAVTLVIDASDSDSRPQFGNETDAPYQMIEMQTMIEQMLELQRQSTRHDDGKQEERETLLPANGTATGGKSATSGTQDLDTLWVEFISLKKEMGKSQEEVMRNQEEAMRNHDAVMRNQEEVMKMLSTIETLHESN